MLTGDIYSSKLHYCFAQSLIFHNFCSKSSTSSRGWHFPVIGGISRSLAGISRSTPRHFPIIGRHFPVIGFCHFGRFPRLLQIVLQAASVARRVTQWLILFNHPEKTKCSQVDYVSICHNHWNQIKRHICWLCWHISIKVWTTDIHTDWIFPKQQSQLQEYGLNSSSKFLIREMKSSNLNQVLCLHFCLFRLPHALLWKLWLKPKRGFERSLIDSFL